MPYDRIVKAESEPANWLTYAGSYKSQRYTQLDQINKQNVTQLKPAWVYQLRAGGVFETSPVVVDGVMYMTEPPSTVTALDVRTGRPLWSWTPKIPDDVIVIGSPPVNRGVAVLDNMVYAGSIAGHLAALDAKSGRAAMGRRRGRQQDRLLPDARAARDRRQDHRRRVGRGERHPRVRRRVRREDRQARLAAAHDSGAGRARQRDLGRQGQLEDRRRLDLAHRVRTIRS